MMEYWINIIYKFIKNHENVKILGKKDNTLYYYYLYRYLGKNKEIVYCYLNLYPIFSALISLIIFIIFWKFNLCIISWYIINYIITFLSISFIINVIILIANSILGLYRKIYQKDDELFDECLERIFSYLNFLLNLSLIYYIFDLDIYFINTIQYNFYYRLFR